ncbi:TIP41-like family-domain-containing protein [Aspergillus californicus]
MTSHNSTAPMPITGNTAAVSPTSQKPNSINVKGFKISTQKLPILKAEPIEAMTKKLGIAPPEMIFGDNFVAIEHEKSGWGINFNSFDALDRVDKTGESMLKVAYSGEWQKSRETTHEGIKEIVKPFDWSYSTDYKGTVLSTQGRYFKETSTPIPIELLKRPDPILFFDEVILYEDELADNGIAMLSCKIRVMPGRLLLLSRFFMRLDNVLFRLRDTRVYVDFEKSEVIREYQARECDYETVRQKLVHARDDIPAIMRDPNRLSGILPVVDAQLELVTLGE